jgi:hypothetical protein
MKSQFLFFGILVTIFVFLLSSCSSDEVVRLDSPDGRNNIVFILKDGVPYYRVLRDNRAVIDTSGLGFELKEMMPLRGNFKMEQATLSGSRERWEPVWGQRSRIRDHHSRLLVTLKEQEEPYRKMQLEFKAFDDGVAFRYIIPEQSGLAKLEIIREATEFVFIENMSAWWIPGDYDHHEFLYRNTPLNEIDSANTPLTMESADSLCLSLHEAALVDYPEMRLKRSEDDPLKLMCDLVPWPDGIKAKVEVPFKTPWRTIQLAGDAGGLIESSLILNLNEPTAIEDVSWIRPMKHDGTWWEFEMAANAEFYEKQIDSAFAIYQNQGIHAIKTGYVGRIRPLGQYHHGQWMVNHQAMVVEKAARHQIMVNAHETVKATGLERTWPNFMTSGWARGNEYEPGNRVHTTLVKQLALMIVIYSPIQMAADLIENYEGDPAFRFIRDVPADWDETKVLNGKIGDYVTIARKKKDAWYIGSVTDENAREFTLKLDFLEEKMNYEAVIYADGPSSDWITNPLEYLIENKLVKKDDELVMKLAAGGGQAVVIRPIE